MEAISRHTETQQREVSELIDAASRPMRSSSVSYWAIVASLGAIVLWGAIAYVYQLVYGLKVTGLNDSVFWGLYTVDLVTFIGLSYGGALVSAILRLTNARWRTPITRMAEAVALVTLVIGAAFPVIHLGSPQRAWEFFVTPRLSSPLVWDMIAIMTYLIATAIFLYLPAIPDMALYRDGDATWLGRWRSRFVGLLAADWRGHEEQHHRLEKAVTVIAVLIIPVAISVHSVLAWAFSVTSRPGWHSSIYAPYFVVAALYSGVALVIVVVAAFRKAYRLNRYIGDIHFRNLGYILLTLGAAYLYFTLSEMLTEGYVAAHESLAVLDLLLIGRYSPLFWIFVVGGLIVPILLVALPGRRMVSRVTTASVLVVGAMWLKRFLIVVPALAHPLIGEAVASYSPSWVEVSITIAATAAVPLLLILFFRLFPILPVSEMVHELQDAGETSVERSRAVSPIPARGGEQL